MSRRRCVLRCEGKSPLYALPKVEQHRSQWLKFIFTTDPVPNNLPNILLCARHFTEDSFRNRAQFEAGFSQLLLLKDGALPTLCGPSKDSGSQPQFRHGRPRDTSHNSVDARAETATSRPHQHKRHCPDPVFLGDGNHSKDTMVWQSSAMADGEAQEESVSKGHPGLQPTHSETRMLTEIPQGGMRTTLAKRLEETEALKKQKQQHQCSTPNGSFLSCGRLTPEAVHHSSVPKYFEYCTGFSYDQYNKLCSFFGLPSSAHIPQSEVPLTFMRLTKSVKSVPLRVQFLLVLMKLRNNFDIKDLAFRFQIDPPSVSIIFRSWVCYLYNKLGQIPTWPHRDVIAAQMPMDYKRDCPTMFAILDCAEIKSYSENKLTSLKGLVACDPRGSVMFVSQLFAGSVSDTEVFNRCGIMTHLKNLIMCGYLHKGDGVMAHKGLLVDNDIKKLGLKLNVPPAAKSSTQVCGMDPQTTKAVAKHRMLIEKAVGKIKKFKIASNTKLKNINEIWFVVSMLSNFQPHII